MASASMGVGVFLTIFIAGIVLSALWVYDDAKSQSERGGGVTFTMGELTVKSPIAWFLCCLVVWEVFFPLYLEVRSPAT